MPKSLTLFLCLGLLLLVYSCKPWGVLSTKEMTALLVDIHLAEAMNENKAGQVPATWRKGLNGSNFTDLSYEAVLKKHGVSEDDFYKSVAYYSKNLRLYSLIYSDVEARLKNYVASIEREDIHQVTANTLQSVIEANKDRYLELYNLLSLYTDTTAKKTGFVSDTVHSYINYLTNRFMHAAVLGKDTFNYRIQPDSVITDSLSATMETSESSLPESSLPEPMMTEPVQEQVEVIRRLQEKDSLIRHSKELARKINAKKPKAAEFKKIIVTTPK
jgi:hypothetical protein